MLKRRSPRACRLCRDRKVRCDVARTGVPCSNCAKASKSCSIQAARKGRLTERPSTNTLPSESVRVFEVDSRIIDSGPLRDTRTSPVPLPGTSLGQPTPESLPAIPARRHRIPAQNQSPSNNLPQLPEFIAPLSTDLSQDTLEFLHRHGAFIIPEQPLMEEVLRLYVCYIHPMLPLLDLGHLLSAFHGNAGSAISLALTQAIVFMSSTLMDLAQLKLMGFDNRPDARRALFNRVKVLYEMDIELNPLTMIQILLLMTYWYGQQNDTKGRFHWLRIAMSLAIDIGLDRGDATSSTHSQSSFRRRLWCCCVMREKLLSMTERRVCSLLNSRPDISAPQLEDFQDAAFAESLRMYYMPDREVEANTMASLCVQKVKLCLIIGRILDSQYELSGLRHVNSAETFMVLIPKKTPDNPSQALSRDRELREWRSETASSLDCCFAQDHRRNGRVIGVHSATIEMLYCTAISMVHRPQMLHDYQRGSAIDALQSFSQQALRSAARRIAEIGRHLQDGYLVQFLPPIAIGAFIMSSIQHLKDALSADAELRSTGHLYLNQTLEAFSALRDMYNSADCALSFIERVRSGKLPYHSFEWENRAESESRLSRGESSNFVAATNGQDTINTDQRDVTVSNDLTYTPSPSQQSSAQALSRGTPSSRLISGNYVGNAMTYNHASEIENVSEILLSTPFDINELEWTNVHWTDFSERIF